MDDRGTFSNIDLLNGIEENFVTKRIYFCKNFKEGMVRAFHYHKHESKVIICLSGAIKVVTTAQPTPVKQHIDYSQEPIVGNFEYGPFITGFLEERDNDGIYIKEGLANGWQSLTSDAMIMVLSNKTVQESMSDDIRYPANAYDWSIKWR